MKKGKKNLSKTSNHKLNREKVKVRLVSYHVSYDPLPDPEFEALPEKVQEQAEKLFYLLRKNPQEVVPECLELVERYPNIPKFRNLLYAAYGLNGQAEKMEQIVIETYRKFPDYLFARLNYVEHLMRNDRLDEVPEVLDGVFDLRLLYPEREVFHITEFDSFFTTVGCYFARIDKADRAKVCLEVLREFLDEDEKKVRILTAELMKANIRRILAKRQKRKKLKAEREPSENK